MRKITLLFLLFFCAYTFAQKDFISVKNGRLVKNEQPYHYVGTNFWYGAILGSEGIGGNRKRLCKELDYLKKIGIDNLRILVGADGKNLSDGKVQPVLQKSPGVYNDSILAGLDFLLMEMAKRQMVAVLYLNNSWEWSGGYGYYLEQAGLPAAPSPVKDGYSNYMNYVSQFANNTKAQELFFDYVRFIITRTNRYTKKKYTEDPAIMSWQIGNEPRAFSKEAIPGFLSWMRKASALIRSLDKNHLISTGSEGYWGCEGDIKTYTEMCADPNIDYCNIHIWPYNWGWAKKESLMEDISNAKAKTAEYIQEHVDVCREINKPLVIEEFGYPRDGFQFSKKSPVTARNQYYKFIFDIVNKNAKENGFVAGCNFWGWGGMAQPRHIRWQVGDDYTGDPAQEEQGLNSVFKSDKTTTRIIKHWKKN